MIRVIKWILGILTVGFVSLQAFSFHTFGPPKTNVSFQTDDGEWADREVLFKGRDFESMVFSYEVYKIVCDKPNAILQRTTRKPQFWNLEWWFDDFNHPKWAVSYAQQHKNFRGEYYYPPVSMEHCFNKSVKAGVLDLAKSRADEYITSNK